MKNHSMYCRTNSSTGSITPKAARVLFPSLVFTWVCRIGCSKLSGTVI